MFDILFFPFFAFGAIVSLIVGLILFVFWILMIIDCAKRNFKNETEKIIWIIVVVLFAWVGSLVYYIVIRLLNPRGIYKK